MKRMTFLFIILCILATPLAMAWESAVHAKAMQDVCRAVGFGEADATRVGDGGWFDGNDIRIDRQEGKKGVSFIRNQDCAFNTGVLAEGTPVKTYGKFSISANDTRYLNARKYLLKAEMLVKEGNRAEALYALGVGVRALQNIFANRDVANDAAWTTRGKMENGASAWIPGLTFDSAWHNVRKEDDSFSPVHADALKAALQATNDYVAEFLKKCPQVLENVKPLSNAAIDGIVAEEVALLSVRRSLSRQVTLAGREAMARLDDAVAAFPSRLAMVKEDDALPYALTTAPAQFLKMRLKNAWRQSLKDLQSDIDDFSGSLEDAKSNFTKTIRESLDSLRKEAEEVAQAMEAASKALKGASKEQAYAQARKNATSLYQAIFARLKSYGTPEDLFIDRILYLTDVLHSQMEDCSLAYDVAIMKARRRMKERLPNSPDAFAEFKTAASAAVEAYAVRCDDVLADFEQMTGAVAAEYGKDAEVLRKSAAEQVGAAKGVLSDKMKQAREAIEQLPKIPQGGELPPAFDDTLKRMMKDASELKDSVLRNIEFQFAYHRDEDPGEFRRLLASRTTRQDFLRPIDIGSKRPDSWKPAIWHGDDELEITFIRRPSVDAVEKMHELFNKGTKLKGQADDANKAVGYAEDISENGFTKQTADNLVKDAGSKVAGNVGGKAIGKATSKVIGKIVGSRFGPLGSKVGSFVADVVGEAAGEYISNVAGDHIADAINWAFGEGAADTVSQNIVDGANWISDVIDVVDGVVNDILMSNPVNQFGEDMHQLIVNNIYEPIWNYITGDDEVDSTPDVINDVDNILNDYDMDNPLERFIAMLQLQEIMDKVNEMIGNLMDMIASITMQIRGLLMNIMNLAVNIQKVDISSEMDQSLQALTNDLNTMMGKDDEQDKSVKRKATIENKGRDLKRDSNPGRDLKGAPGVKQIKMD